MRLGLRARRAPRAARAESRLSRTEEQAGAVFAALADPTRREIAQLLASDGPLTQTELARRLPITRQGVAKHLAALQEAGLVEPTRAGRESRFALTPAPFATAALWMAALGAEWDARLHALRRLLERG
ncbi:MAG TPA: winged helix-turn-helix domain-containing protein [Gaiellaceae bacterium]|nr:winged helix-turn-helix domain-containing protein [Gaiellaceae bacterium]